jgi:hypothetical protein
MAKSVALSMSASIAAMFSHGVGINAVAAVAFDINEYEFDASLRSALRGEEEETAVALALPLST